MPVYRKVLVTVRLSACRASRKQNALHDYGISKPWEKVAFAGQGHFTGLTLAVILVQVPPIPGALGKTTFTSRPDDQGHLY